MRLLIHLVNQLLDSWFGLRVQPSSSKRLRCTRLDILESFGCEVVVDVGANNGSWARSLRHHGFSGKIESFEPTAIFSKLEETAMSDEMWTVHKVALSDFSGEAGMNLADNGYLSSSLLSPSGIYETNKGINFTTGEKVTVTTLDEYLFESSKKEIYLKLDVQGAELSVLKGGEKFLTLCRAVEFESALITQYEGEASHYEIVDWLHSKGFREKQVVVTHWNKNLETVALDSIFVRV